MRIPKLLVLVILLLLSIAVSAQKEGLINSGELLKKGIELNDQGKYKEAISIFNKISRSDTNYSSALHELSLSSNNDSNFVAGLKYAQEGLRLFPEQTLSWYSLMATAYDEMQERNKALELYNKIIAVDNNNFLAFFNKGITLMRMEKTDEAKASFQQCLLINPYYVSAHYFLGYLALEEGLLPEAMMSYAACLTINPGNRYYNRAIGVLANIGKMENELLEKAAKRKQSGTDDFSFVQEILVNKLSLDKKYKLKASLEDPVVRQLQVLLEKLEYNSADKGFWMQFYVPFYTDIFSKDHFEPFVYHMLSQLEIKQVTSYVKRNDKPIKNLTDFAAEYFDEIKSTRELQLNKRALLKKRFFYTSNTLVGIGEAQEKANETFLLGPWEFYHSNGQLKSKGKLNDNQEKIGAWEFYYSNGQLKEKANYVNGKAEGKGTSWFDNGLIATEAEYKNDEIEGLYKEYYYNGSLKKIETYKGGKLNGPAKGFTVNSTPSYSLIYKDGKENSDVVYYHNNGNINSVVKYVEGEANGGYKEYYYSGKLKVEGNYEKDNKSGVWNEYHLNGKLSVTSNYAEGMLEGDYKSFYESGQLQTKMTYKKGKVDGKVETYDDDGKPASESYYEKDRLKEIRFFDKSGNVIGSSTSRNGAGNFVFFDPQGNKMSEGYYTKEGLQKGKGTYFYRSGKTSVIAEYQEGLLNGLRTEFYKNGQKSYEGNYLENIEDGFHTSYYQDGKVKDEGWIIKGERQGEHISYNKFGVIISRINYLNDDQHGYTQYFHDNGKIDYEQLFDEGWLKQITQFDTTGKVLAITEIPKGKADFQFKFYNGKSYLNGSYNNYYLNGEYRIFYPDASLNAVQYYKMGLLDSTYKSYHYGGKLAVEGNYNFGTKQGNWKYFHEDGSLSYTETYADGSINGKVIMYNEDKSLDKEIEYRNGELHGTYKVYGDNNQLAVQYQYEYGFLTGYTYESKEGKLIPLVGLKNSTGAVRSFYKNGNKSAELNIVDNEGEGLRKLFFSNGKTYVEVTKVNGYEHGPKKIYFSSGQLERDENYYYGDLHGSVKTYYPDGKIKSQENYHNGNLNGECKYYNSNGNTEVRVYFYGVMQSVK